MPFWETRHKARSVDFGTFQKNFFSAENAVSVEPKWHTALCTNPHSILVGDFPPRRKFFAFTSDRGKRETWNFRVDSAPRSTGPSRFPSFFSVGKFPETSSDPNAIKCDEKDEWRELETGLDKLRWRLRNRGDARKKHGAALKRHALFVQRDRGSE